MPWYFCCCAKSVLIFRCLNHSFIILILLAENVNVIVMILPISPIGPSILSHFSVRINSIQGRQEKQDEKKNCIHKRVSENSIVHAHDTCTHGDALARTCIHAVHYNAYMCTYDNSHMFSFLLHKLNNDEYYYYCCCCK